MNREFHGLIYIHIYIYTHMKTVIIKVGRNVA